MRYNKQIFNGFIVAVGSFNGGEEISEAEYNTILEVVRNKPTATETTDYRLREDLTWEAYEVEPPEPSEPSVEDKAEAYDILMGVSE